MNHDNPTPDEIMVVCMARQLVDGEMVVQGLATPLVAAAYLLAKKTHAPNLYFASAIGQGLCRQPAKLSINHVERLWLDRSLVNLGFVRVATEFLPRFRPKEFFRPAQLDKFGNFNNIAYGKNYRQPRLRLPGTGGIPDVTTYMENVYLYVPRHSKVTFVMELDFHSGLGYNPARTLGRGPRYLISDLGQFDFADGRLRITTYHPGIDIDRIKLKTGFELDIAPDIHETPYPSQVELHLLREEIDPLGIRRLELLSGSSRRKLIHEILIQE
jgi:acyl CoA:acetate/3-ketoacid CoA transferase beta subunit